MIASGINASINTSTSAAVASHSAAHHNLGDAVRLRQSWKLADQLGWSSTYNAEYVALAQLPVGAFMTLDEELARVIEGAVPAETANATLNLCVSGRGQLA